MDLQKYLHELYLEKKTLDQAIAALEAKAQRANGPTSSDRRRGRKSMSPEERLQVSRRMASYWAAKRAASTASSGCEPNPQRQEPAAESTVATAATA